MPGRLARIGTRKQLIPITTAAPGNYGLNLQQENTVLPPQWSTEALNAVIDQSHRVAARLGDSTVTTTPIAGAPKIKTLWEQRRSDGTGDIIVAWDGDISKSVTNPSANSIKGAVNAANGSWHFANFNDKVIGFQPGGTVAIVRSTGNFAYIVASSGTAPTGAIGTAAFGRVWQLDGDGHTIKYSGLLNETQWASGGAGSIDMQNVWTRGTDEVIAIAGFNHTIVVFGRRHIVFFGDNNPTALGLDVTSLRVVDLIEGSGCVTQHSVQNIGTTDMIWLSSIGVQSMSRLVVQASRPVVALTKYVRDTLVGQLATEVEDTIRSVYSPTYGFYLLSFTTSKQTWCVDLRHPFQDEDGDVINAITRWNIAPTAMIETQLRILYLSGIPGGTVGQYLVGGDNGLTYHFKWQSTWTDFGTDYSSRLKILKRIGALLLTTTALSITFSYFVDFDVTARAASTDSFGGPKAEWGIGEWGIAEWSGGSLLQLLHVPVYATGQYFRFSIETDVSNVFAVQTGALYAKLGSIT